MASRRDYYEVLGVAVQAGDDEIKRAYKKLVLEFHPDRNQGDPIAEDRFKEATAAYAVLSDPDKRRRYDKLGHAAFAGASGNDTNLESLDPQTLGEVLEGLFVDVFRGGRKGRKARDLKYDLTLRFEEAALGCEKTIDVERNVMCESCRGSGAAAGHTPELCGACKGKGEVRYQRGFLPATRPCQACQGRGKKISVPCGQCRGEGVTPKREALRVSIPAGVADGSVRSVRDAGEQTPTGSGDLHITVHIEPHELFQRDGADVRCRVPVSYPQAALGDELEVPTLDGKVKMRIPPGTVSGTVFRLRGKGIPVFGGVGKGDQLVEVTLEVPAKVTPRERELLEALAAEMGDASLPERKRFRDRLRGLFG